MGSGLSSLVGWKPKKLPQVLMMGLDGAGKTALLYRWKLNDFVSTVPTIGFNVEEVNGTKQTFSMWDVGLRSAVRAISQRQRQRDRERQGESESVREGESE